jgi:hypothetical protein
MDIIWSSKPFTPESLKKCNLNGGDVACGQTHFLLSAPAPRPWSQRRMPMSAV